MPRLLLILIFCTSPLQASNLSLEQRISTALDTPALDGKAIWLEAGEVRFLTIYSPSREKISKGYALLLHDAGAHANWAEVIRPLRQHLSTQGWDTLSLQLPTSSYSNSANSKTLLKLAIPRIQAVIGHFKKQRNWVLVGHGLGAAMALNYAAKQPNNNIKAIAAISLSIPTHDNQDPVKKAIASLKLPILDLFGSRDLPSVMESAEERRRVALDNGQDRYRQEKVIGADHYFRGVQSSLTRRVQAWLWQGMNQTQ
ncbi:MAG: DUF3530 family protein [Candidatus Thiodiazotropha sp.]|jgi:pimeloyl-ACP methyl ester carboxylesterase